MKILGLTGSIGMGKSTTAKMFADAGLLVYDADAEVHALYAPGGAAVGPLSERFGDILKNGGVDRAALRAKVVDNPEAMRDLEAIVHPLVGLYAAFIVGLITALIVAKIMFGKADLTMALNGALAGLVAITAEPSTPSALQATLFGGIGGVLVVFSIVFLDKLKIDDPVGAISVHGVVGLLGLLLVPVTNDGSSFSGQLIGAATIFGWVFVTSFIVWFVLKMIMGIRVSEEEEYEGVDLAECGMEAYPEFKGSQ